MVRFTTGLIRDHSNITASASQSLGQVYGQVGFREGLEDHDHLGVGLRFEVVALRAVSSTPDLRVECCIYLCRIATSPVVDFLAAKPLGTAEACSF